MSQEVSVESPVRSERRKPTSSLVHLSPQELPFLLTFKDAAAFLRTTPKALYTLHERRRLPGVVRFGGRLLIRRDDLLASLAEVGALPPKGTRR